MGPVVAIVGPTASGKTDLSLYLAKKLDGEIVSADAMQVYQGLDIATAKIPIEDRVVPHHLLDIVDPSENFSVADYQKLAVKAITDIRRRNKRPIFVGGTGLYLKATLDGLLFPEPQKDEKLRDRLYAQAVEFGNEYLYRRLLTCDEDSAQKIHPNDIRRIVRALEVYIKTGEPLSRLQEKHRIKGPAFETCWIGLTRGREILYKRIDHRVDLMLEDGLLEEVTALYDKGLSKTSTAYQALGYKEFIWYLEGFTTLAETIRILKRDTRHYAKRQLSWFRRDKRIKWFDSDDYRDESALNRAVLAYVKGKTT